MALSIDVVEEITLLFFEDVLALFTTQHLVHGFLLLLLLTLLYGRCELSQVLNSFSFRIVEKLMVWLDLFSLARGLGLTSKTVHGLLGGFHYEVEFLLFLVLAYLLPDFHNCLAGSKVNFFLDLALDISEYISFGLDLVDLFLVNGWLHLGLVDFISSEALFVATVRGNGRNALLGDHGRALARVHSFS